MASLAISYKYMSQSTPVYAGKVGLNDTASTRFCGAVSFRPKSHLNVTKGQEQLIPRAQTQDLLLDQYTAYRLHLLHRKVWLLDEPAIGKFDIHLLALSEYESCIGLILDRWS